MENNYDQPSIRNEERDATKAIEKQKN